MAKVTKQKEEVTIGDTNIAKLRYPRVWIKNMYPSYKKVIDKALTGKKLTELQIYKLKFIFEIAKDFPEIPNNIKLQLADLYREQLNQFIESESYENAIEIRDIIKELEGAL